MNRPALPWDGGCRCGKLRFRIAAPPMLTMACHCTGCQRMTASAYSLSLAVPTEAFEITAGESVLGGLRGDIAHHHCPQCMSWVFTKAKGLDWFVNVRATMLDDATWYSPFIETWTAEKLSWASTPAVHSFPEFPTFDQYGELTKAFAEAG